MAGDYGDDVQAHGPIPASPHPRNSERRTRAFIKVQDGCRNKCTFCIVTVARGAERSRPIAEIVAEIRGLHEEGFQEAVLTGVHLGGYGSDLGTGLSELTAAVLAETEIPRLRLSSLEPFDLQPGFFDFGRRPAAGSCRTCTCPRNRAATRCSSAWRGGTALRISSGWSMPRGRRYPA